MAKRIEPSGHLFLTSVCVLNAPTRTPLGAAPCGSACPNVAQPVVRLIVPSVCAHTGEARNACRASTVASVQHRRSERIQSTQRVVAGGLTHMVGQTEKHEKEFRAASAISRPMAPAVKKR